MTEQQRQRIEKKIKKIHAGLKAEKRKFGGYFDNQGNRYTIGVLYADIKDYKGLIKYYKWFNKAFPDDIGFPELHLAWIIAGIKENKLEMVKNHLPKLEEINSYIIPKIVGKKVLQVDKWEGMNLSTEEYADSVIDRSKSWMDEEVIKKLETVTSNEKYQFYKKKVIECDIKLKEEEDVSQRGKIGDEREQYIADWKGGVGEILNL